MTAFRRHGRGVRRVQGQMNKLEAAYADHLRVLQLGGRIVWYSFDAIKVRLADNTFYTPDFLVMTQDGTLEVHEVKGFWEDDARVKIKVAADKFPFRFLAITKQKGQWIFENFGHEMPPESSEASANRARLNDPAKNIAEVRPGVESDPGAS